MLPYDDVHLIADPLYGYTRITVPNSPGEVAEADIIDNPWVQRLKRVHQLQSSWWVFPTAEHSRFAHSLGVMHLAGQLAREIYPTLVETLKGGGGRAGAIAGGAAAGGAAAGGAATTSVPSAPLVEETLRLAGLLHDIGHGPFSHFFDEEYLRRFPSDPAAPDGPPLNHEIISQHLITHELAPEIAALRRSPSGPLADGEAVDPAHVARLIHDSDVPGSDVESAAVAAGAAGDAEGAADVTTAPGAGALRLPPAPRWVHLLRLALNGAITVDNMDYVRRDAYMCGVSLGAVDVERLLYYTFVAGEGLTYHKRAIGALRAFLNARFYMYENVYFHRIGRAIDLHLREIFPATMELVLPQSPLADLGAYQRLTEWSLFTTVEGWLDEPPGSERRRLAEEWQAIIHRDVKYRLAFEQSVERQQVHPASRDMTWQEFEAAIRAHLPARLRSLAFVVDVASQDPRPLNPMRGPKRIHVFDPGTGAIEEQLLTGILEFVPAKAHLYRVFATTRENDADLAAAARAALGEVGEASATNL
jgi:HD superfamily phosphohydrolase